MLRMMKEAIGEGRGLQSEGREQRVTFCQGLGDDFQAGALLFVSKTLAPLPDYMDPINSGKGCQTLPPVLGVCYGYLGFYAEIAPSTADCLLYLEGGQSFAAASCAVAVGYTVSRMGGAEQGMAAAAGSCAQLFRGGAIGSSTDVVGGAEAAKQAQKVKVENPEREGGNIDYFGTGSMSPFRVMPKVKTTSRHLSAGPQCTHAHAHKLVAGQGSTQALRRGLKKVRMKKPKPHLKEPMAAKLEAVASALVVSEARAALAAAEEKGAAAALRVVELEEKLRLSEAREARAEAAPAQAACEDDAGGVLAGSSFGRVGAAIDGRHPPERCPSAPISFLHTLPQPGGSAMTRHADGQAGVTCQTVMLMAPCETDLHALAAEVPAGFAVSTLCPASCGACSSQPAAPDGARSNPGGDSAAPALSVVAIAALGRLQLACVYGVASQHASRVEVPYGANEDAMWDVSPFSMPCNGQTDCSQHPEAELRDFTELLRTPRDVTPAAAALFCSELVESPGGHAAFGACIEGTQGEEQCLGTFWEAR